MRPALALLLTLGFLASVAHGQDSVDPASSVPQAFFGQFCRDCHTGDEAEADLRLDALTAPLDIAQQHASWIRVAEVVRAGEMPPGDEPQPTAELRQQFLQWLEPALKTLEDHQTSQPGRVTIRRLNRAEYNNTVRDLVGVDFQPAETFPADDVGNGFDNLADVLSLPPLLMEKYLEAADQIVRRALDDERLRNQLITSWPVRSEQRPDCARQVLQRFASRAFRRPVQPEELERLLQLVQQTADAGADYVPSLEPALQAVLISPHFLFRIERDEHPDGEQGVRMLNGYELASRLSYFLWSSMPDDALLRLAESDQLADASVRQQQVRRMLADPKSEALVDNFAGQWLELRNLAKLTPDTQRYPDFDESLRAAMLGETESFCRVVIAEDRSVLDFLDADYTFVNERLARHYGLPGVQGEGFRQVSLPDRRRGGLLTQASILTLTSNPTRTSPVKRGKWILENILGAPPPPPPPGVLQLMEGEQAELLGSLRERMEQHRSNPSCAMCHKKMDALGFGFENFDAIGAWRERDGQFAIDASGELPGPEAFAGPAELRRILQTSRRGEFLHCLAEKTLTYAVGRAVETYDRYSVDQIVQRLEAEDYRFSALVLAVVESAPFLMRGFRGETQ